MTSQELAEKIKILQSEIEACDKDMDTYEGSYQQSLSGLIQEKEMLLEERKRVDQLIRIKKYRMPFSILKIALTLLFSLTLGGITIALPDVVMKAPMGIIWFFSSLLGAGIVISSINHIIKDHKQMEIASFPTFANLYQSEDELTKKINEHDEQIEYREECRDMMKPSQEKKAYLQKELKKYQSELDQLMGFDVRPSVELGKAPMQKRRDS